jgi:hypothetical protein
MLEVRIFCDVDRYFCNRCAKGNHRAYCTKPYRREGFEQGKSQKGRYFSMFGAVVGEGRRRFAVIPVWKLMRLPASCNASGLLLSNVGLSMLKC